MNAGETDLQKLLKTLKPVLNPGEFVFCHINALKDLSDANVIMTFRETEGLTVIISKADADRLNLSYTFVASWITLTVHSSLEAVGLTAAFAQALAKNGISCNAVAAYFHDHIFVDHKDVKSALQVLGQLSKG